MTVSFPEVNGDIHLHVNNGLASRLLRAMGYRVSEASDGSMPVVAAKWNITQAMDGMSEEDRPYAESMVEILDEYEEAGKETIEWF